MNNLHVTRGTDVPTSDLEQKGKSASLAINVMLLRVVTLFF